MKTKEQIIHDMCYTMRHDYGLRISTEDRETRVFISGMTDDEAKFLYNQMKQLFENSIEPYIVVKDQDND